METPAWQRAASFAARAHEGQLRKDKKTPYVAHVFRVAMTVRDTFGCDDPIALNCALLHDTIEDCPTDFDDIEKRFGRDTADAVAAMTKNMLLREPEREADYDARLSVGPWQARLVKLADVFDNGHDVPSGSKTSRIAGRAHRALALSDQDADMPVFKVARAAVRGLLERLEADRS